MQNGYRDDLAHIHDAGFGQLAENAAPVLIDALKHRNAHGGLVVDLGCGGGITARRLRDAGYDVLGIDLSEAQIERARRRVPDAAFRVGSFATADLPSCVAVTAIGEVFNYAFDATNSDDLRTRLFARIHAALAPGGLLLFDMAGPARAAPETAPRTCVEGDDWAVLVGVEIDAARRLLTRHITSFRRIDALYRRDVEVHRLQLAEPALVAASLRRAGFAVRMLRSYGPLALPRGLTAFLARKRAPSDR